MAQIEYIGITNANMIIPVSPWVTYDTLYYEFWLQITGNPNWTQYIVDVPLKYYTIGSPATSQPCIVIEQLANTTAYNFQVRRFDINNNPSNWVSGSFTTGS